MKQRISKMITIARTQQMTIKPTNS